MGKTWITITCAIILLLVSVANGVVDFDDDVWIYKDSGQGKLLFWDDATNYISLRAGELGSNHDYVWPISGGTGFGNVIVYDAGVMRFAQIYETGEAGGSGLVGLGAATNPSEQLHVRRLWSNTNAVQTIARFDRRVDSDVGDDGIGIGIDFYVDDEEGNMLKLGHLRWDTNDVSGERGGFALGVLANGEMHDILRYVSRESNLGIFDEFTGYYANLRFNNLTQDTAWIVDLTNDPCIIMEADFQVEQDSIVNQDLTTDASPTFAGLTLNGTLGVTGVTTITGLATGGRTDYDLKVGDTTTPDYGMIQFGNAVIGRTSYKAGQIDLDGSILFQNIGGPVTGKIEFCFAESSGNSTRFALPKSGDGLATYNPRSMLIAGPAPVDTNFVMVSYWQLTENIFDNLDCNTSVTGADLGVQNDLEVEGDIFVDSIKESTTNAGITFSSDIIAGDITGTTLTFDFINDYKFLERGAGQAIALQNQASNIPSRFEFFAKDGDRLDGMEFTIYAKGLPSSVTNSEFVRLSYQTLIEGGPKFVLSTGASGGETVHPLSIYTGANTSQIVLAIDGTVSMASDLTINDLIIGDARFIGSVSDPDSAQIEADGDWLFSQELTVSIINTEFIIRTGDADTLITLGDDTFNFQAGGVDMLQITESGRGQDEVVVNEGQVDIDFRVEGSGNANLIQTDAANDRVGIKTASPNTELDVVGDISIGGSNNELRFYEGANYVGFEAPALSANQIWVLPAADGSSGDVLTTNGSGALSFTANASEKTWAFMSRDASSGTNYIGGFYKFGSSDNDFNPSITHGTANVSYAAHFFLVQAAGASGGTDTVIRVTGTTIDDQGNRTATVDVDITVDDAGAANTYYETTEKWLGQVTIAKQSGPDLLCNYGFAKYWDNNNTAFKVVGIEATWLGAKNDATPDIELRHHKATGWTYNNGAEPTPPAVIASMATDHNTEIQIATAQEGAWKRDNLSTNIDGGSGEGTIIELTTTTNRTYAIGNFLIRITPQ